MKETLSKSLLWLAVGIALTTSTKGWAQGESDSLKIAMPHSQKENKLGFSVNYLLHGEACGGALPRDVDPDTGHDIEDKSYFLLNRLRLNVDYERPNLQVHATIQNKNVWGSSNSQALNLYEGWVKLYADCGLFAQVGRVALSYDDERIIGLNDFATAALSHDVLKLGYEGHGHKVHALLGFNQNASHVYQTTYYDADEGAQYYKSMQTLWYHYDVPNFPLGASALFMNFGLQAGKDDPSEWDYKSNPAKTVHQQLFGGYVNYHPKFLTLEASYYRQTGKTVFYGKAPIDIRAWMASAKATINPSEYYGFTVGYDHLSGDDYVPVPYGGNLAMVYHDVIRGFAPLYGSRSKFYGILDYFYESAYINGFTPGLQNAFVGVFGQPTPKLDLSLTYHYLATATKLSELNSTLGHSVELTASYRFSKDVSLAAGYTLMTGTETMERLKQENSSKISRWGWFSLIVSPRLFTTMF